MPTRDEIESWLKGERIVPSGPEALQHPLPKPLLIGDHHFGFPFGQTPVGSTVVEVRTGDESVAVLLALPWNVPLHCANVWDYALRKNLEFNLVRFILSEEGQLVLVAEHPSGNPRSGDYFWETGVVTLFAAAFTAAEQTRGELIDLLDQCEEQTKRLF